MADDDATGGETTEEELAAELEEARAETERLRAEVEKLEAKPERRHRLRRILTPILAALTVITFTVAVPGVWARRTIVNHDAYLKTVGPLASDPTVQKYIANQLTTQVFATLNVQQVITNALPDQAAILAGPLTSAAQDFVRKQVLKVVQTEAFQTLWVAVNGVVHDQVIAVLNGDQTAVQVVKGKVEMNLLPMVNLALQQLQTVASGLLPSGVTIPDIQVNEVPQEAIARLEQALGVQLPDNFGTISVYNVAELKAAQQAFNKIERLVVFVVVLWLLLLVATLWVAVRKRRALLQVTIGSIVGLVLVRRLVILGKGEIVDRARPENRAAAAAVAEHLTHTLRLWTGLLLIILLIVLVVALITAPYPWAVRFRGWATGMGKAIAGAPSAARSEPVVSWVQTHRDLLMVCAAGIGVLLLFFINVSFWGFLIIAVLVGLAEVALYRLGATASEPSEPIEPVAGQT